MARERIEDLGRLAVMLRTIIFDGCLQDLGDAGGVRSGRPKSACDFFFALDEEGQRAIIHDLAYGLQTLENALYECLSIADGREEADGP